MPVVTRSMSLAERAFSWPTMPSFGFAANSGSMKDRLLEINTEVLQLAHRLLGCLALVREKIAQDRKIESYFFQHTAAQETVRRTLLRNLQAQRIYIDCLESQNDRLAGLAIKLDPNFAKTQDFQLMTGPGLVFKPKPKKKDDSNKDGDDGLNQDNHGSRHPGGGGFSSDSGLGGPALQTFESAPSGIAPSQSRRSSNYSGSQHPSKEQNDFENDLPLDELTTPHQPEMNQDDLPLRENSDPDEPDEDRQSDLDVPQTDVNYSASGGGPPAIWIQQGTITSSGPGEVGRRSDGRPVVDVEMTRRLEPARGNVRAVEELLIGVDSVASGTGRPGTEVGEHIPTPSFLNTEHYVTSIFDDVMGSSPATKMSGTPRGTLIPARPQGLRTPSTKFSQAEAISPTLSVDQRAVTINSPNSGVTPRNSATPSSIMVSATKETAQKLNQDGHNAYYESRKRFKDAEQVSLARSIEEHSPEVPDADLTDNTLSGMTPRMRRTNIRAHQEQPIVYQNSADQHAGMPKTFDTNVNASDLVLPKIFPRSKHYLIGKVTPPGRSSSASGIRTSKEQKHVYKEPTDSSPVMHHAEQRYLPPTEHEEIWPPFTSGFGGSVQPVPLVGTKECGGACVPDWISRRGSRENKPENLLEEPKRSALSKAMMTHRFRLVETILQADEERLEDLISLLLKE
ncbi:unnamed protein product [Echinostoma caproni]|uniref:DUF5743 domain-containing protein n=1 Tax=Echinostoma caproni TaxID=27848 RepID=A0A183AIJ5_9TREM|nr:unnamed protein product [Echinostoma caproni]